MLPELKLDTDVEAVAVVAPDAPETTAKPETIPESTDAPASETTAALENITEAQDADIPDEYLGAWYGVSMEMEGVSYPLADMGMDLTITIGADGTAEMHMNGEDERIRCSMQDGVLTADGVSFALQDSMLVVSEDGMTMTLSREKPEASAASIPVIDETPQSTISGASGRWAHVTMDGVTLPAEAAGNGRRYAGRLRRQLRSDAAGHDGGRPDLQHGRATRCSFPYWMARPPPRCAKTARSVWR